ncbi:MAG: YqgE/AlgH family protein [Castellaniella sp.]
MSNPKDHKDLDAGETHVSLAGQFLLAMPGMVGGSLANTVIYICEHTEEGALGLVVNRPTDLTVGDLLQRIELDLALEIGPVKDAPVFFGGPVQTDRGFVLHTPSGSYTSSVRMGPMALTTSRDVLQDVSQGQGPARLMVSLGYAGWGAGQLESEIVRNAWLNVDATQEILFDVPAEQRYEAALSQLGIEPAMLMSQAGHA